MKSNLMSMGVVAIVLATLAGCGPGGESNKVKIAENVAILEEGRARLATVWPDRLTFPLAGNEELLDTPAGEILVNGFGEGFLRRVTSVFQDGEQVVLLTEQASLTDVVLEGDLQATMVPTATSQDDVLQSSSLRIMRQGLEVDRERFIGLNLKGTELWFAPSLVDLKMTEGYLRFDPEFTFDMAIANGRIDRFEAKVTGTFDFSFMAKLVVEKMLVLTKRIPLWESQPYIPFPPPMIGPIPVPTTITAGVDLVFDLGVEGKAELEGGMGATASVSGGARYQSGLWSPVVEHNLELKRIGLKTSGEKGKSGIRLSLQPRLDTKFFGVAGPRFFLRPYGTVVAEWDVASICTLVGGIDLGLMLTIAGLDPFLLKYEVAVELVQPVELGRYLGNALGICDAAAGNCVSESDTDFCLGQKKDCGVVTAMDNCGATRSVDCGKCTDPKTCGGSGRVNVCGLSWCGPGSVVYNGWLGRGSNTRPLRSGDDSIMVFLKDIETCEAAPPRQAWFSVVENGLEVEKDGTLLYEGTTYTTPSGKFVLSLNEVLPAPCLVLQDLAQFCLTHP